LGWTHGIQAMADVEEGQTAAEGVRVRRPIRAGAILQVLADRAAGRMVAVQEEEILPAYRAMARLGAHVEPTAALAWAALRDLWGKVPEPIVLILSGTGLKYSSTIS
jgi:threonine synthase